MYPALAGGYIDIYPMVGRTANDCNIDIYHIIYVFAHCKKKGGFRG
jgi:hypothetical protein